jgi:aminoglycoside phosphotransferase
MAPKLSGHFRQPPCSPNIATEDFFLFGRLKLEFAGISLSQDNFKMSLQGVIQTIAKDKFADVFLAEYGPL